MDERDPRLSQAYRQADHPEPSAALDAVILKAARRAVAKTAPRRSGWLRWAVPVSGVAVLMLTMTLVLKVQREAPEQLSSDHAPTPTAAPEKTAPPASAKVESGSNATGQLKRAPPAKAAKARPSADMPPRPAFVPSPNVPETPPAESDTVAVPTRTQPWPEPMEARRAEIEIKREAMKRDAMARPITKSKTAPAAPAADGSAGAPPPVERQEIRNASEERSPLPGIAGDVERIRLLMRRGHDDEARLMLMKLIRRYPDYELPEDLRGLRETIPR